MLIEITNVAIELLNVLPARLVYFPVNWQAGW